MIKWTISTNSRTTVSSDSRHLTLVDVKRRDSGRYKCTASNSAGVSMAASQVQVYTVPAVQKVKLPRHLPKR
eukprot:m.161096 g.161096  ORF g.161096 m.161096 type:complete len:72 (+) comp38798_c0_seq11:435-650(+)